MAIITDPNQTTEYKPDDGSGRVYHFKVFTNSEQVRFMGWLSKIEGALVLNALTKAAIYCMSYFLSTMDENGEAVTLKKVNTKDGDRLDISELDRIPMPHKLGAFTYLQERECGDFVKAKKKKKKGDPEEEGGEKDELDALFDDDESSTEDADPEDLASDLEKPPPPGD